MESDRNTFFSSLLQGLGFISAISTAIFQFTLRDSFKFIFGSGNVYFASSSAAALMLSITIFIGLFAIRMSFPNKIYFSKSKRDEYFAYLNKIMNLKSITDGSANKEIKKLKIVSEPRNFNIIGLSFIFILASLLSFISMMIIKNFIIISLSYILFITFAVTAMSVFSIQLYKDREYKERQKEIDEIILNKIRERFVDKIKITFDSTDYSNWQSPNRIVNFEYKDKTFQVFTKSTDPNSYFNLTEFKPPEIKQDER